MVKEYSNLFGNDSVFHPSVLGNISTTLYKSPITQNTTVTLSDTILNYQFLMIVGMNNLNNHYAVSLILPVLEEGEHAYGITVGNTREYKLITSNETNITFRCPTEREFSTIGGGLSTANKITAIYGLFSKSK